MASTIQCLSQREHVLQRADMYLSGLGVVEYDEEVLARRDDGALGCRRVRADCSPALLKCVGEVVVNALDNQHRGDSMRAIRITVEPDGVVEVRNDGLAVPSTVHTHARSGACERSCNKKKQHFASDEAATAEMSVGPSKHAFFFSICNI